MVLSRALSIKELELVLNELNLAPKEKWQDLGLRLGLYQSTLDTIASDNKNDVEGCLRQCLSAWLRKLDDVEKKGVPTWLLLADALEKIDKATANNIRKKYPERSFDPAPSVPIEYFPDDLTERYIEMNKKFSLFLNQFVEEVTKDEQILKKVKFCLISFECVQEEEFHVVSTFAVDKDLQLLKYLRDRCYLSNLHLLFQLVEHCNLPDLLKKITTLQQERDGFYKTILATDFATRAIKDHKTSPNQKEMTFTVSWSLRDTTLKEFQEFLNNFFHKHRIHISLQSVHNSLLTFVCTIPNWIVDELVVFTENHKHSLYLKGVVQIIIDEHVITTDDLISKQIFENGKSKLLFGIAVVVAILAILTIGVNSDRPFILSLLSNFVLLFLLFLTMGMVALNTKQVEHRNDVLHKAIKENENEIANLNKDKELMKNKSTRIKLANDKLNSTVDLLSEQLALFEAEKQSRDRTASEKDDYSINDPNEQRHTNTLQQVEELKEEIETLQEQISSLTIQLGEKDQLQQLLKQKEEDLKSEKKVKIKMLIDIEKLKSSVKEDNEVLRFKRKQLSSVDLQLREKVEMIGKLQSPKAGDMAYPQKGKTLDLRDHLDVLIRALRKCDYEETTYFSLGIALGISSQKLHAIERDYRETDRCLMECLIAWLRKVEVNVKDPTLEVLQDALISVQHIAAASKIEKIVYAEIYQQRLYDCVSTNPVPLAGVLCGKGLIPAKVLTRVASSNSTEGASIISVEVFKILESDNVQEFANAFKKLPATKTLGDDIMKNLLGSESFEKSLEKDETQERVKILEKRNSDIENEKAQRLTSRVGKQIEIIQDEVYRQITIRHPLLIKIIKSPQFQRLKDIKQLGAAHFVTPRALHTRFQHSIGMCYLANKLVKELKRNQPELDINDKDILCIQVAALCYNMGHGPFSFLFQDLYRSKVAASLDVKPMKIEQASIKIFEHMMEADSDLDATLKFHLNDEDIDFIKDLILGKQGTDVEGKPRAKKKHFLYEIVSNKASGLDVSMIDYTTRDAVAMDLNIPFKWRKFITRVRALECPDGLVHICVQEYDQDNYKELFSFRHNLFRKLYFERKKRIVDLMINEILLRSDKHELIRLGPEKKVTITEAATEMGAAFTQFTDGILDVIRHVIDDKEVQELLTRLYNFQIFMPIGYLKISDVRASEGTFKRDFLKECAERNVEVDPKDIILDWALSGYENHHRKSMWYYTHDGSKIRQWTKDEWQQPGVDAAKTPLRVFCIKRDKALVSELKSAFVQLTEKEPIYYGEVYTNGTDVDYSLQNHHTVDIL